MYSSGRPALGGGAIIVAMAGLCAAAAGQPIGLSVTSANGLAKAVAGDGSGTNQQTSTSTAGYSLSANKTFSTGHATAHTSWGLGSNWILSGSFNGLSSANSPSEAGNSETNSVVVLRATEAFDIEYSGGYSINSPQFASATIELRNMANNDYIVGGQSPNQVHITPGNYRLTVSSFLGYGDLSGGFNMQFRPGNDRCQFAKVVGNGVYTGSTQYATTSGDGQASCGTSNSSKSVWFKYVPVKSGTLEITTCGSSYDTVLSVYQTNSCPSGTGSEVACNDDAIGGECGGTTKSRVSVAVLANTTYYIRLSGYNGASGEYQLNVGPVNDDCENAQPVTVGSYPFDNTLATTDGPVLSSCTNGGLDNQVNGDLWYSFTAPASGKLTVGTCGSSFDTKLAVYNGLPCGRPSFNSCSDDACSLQSRINDINVIRGRTYGIRVGGYLTARGTGTLTIGLVRCSADFNGDGFVDGFDYDDYVACFEGQGCPPGQDADVNGDNFVDGFDYDDFVADFESGC